MNCPHCGSTAHRVIDTREANDAIRRRRQCEKCSQRFTTYEHVAANLLVIKSDGRREPFDRQKLLSGIQVASAKRPISRETIDHMVDQIIEALQAIGRAEAPSKATRSPDRTDIETSLSARRRPSNVLQAPATRTAKDAVPFIAQSVGS